MNLAPVVYLVLEHMRQQTAARVVFHAVAAQNGDAPAHIGVPEQPAILDQPAVGLALFGAQVGANGRCEKAYTRLPLTA